MVSFTTVDVQSSIFRANNLGSRKGSTPEMINLLIKYDCLVGATLSSSDSNMVFLSII